MTTPLRNFVNQGLKIIDPMRIGHEIRRSYPPRNALDVSRLSGNVALAITITVVAGHAVDLFYRTISLGLITECHAYAIVALSPYLCRLALLAGSVSGVAYAAHLGNKWIHARD